MPAKRTSAFSRALQEAQGATVSQQDSLTALPSHSSTVLPLDSTTASQQSSATVSPSHSTTASQQSSATASPSHSDVLKTVEQQNSTTVQPLDSITVSPSHSSTALPSRRGTVVPSHREEKEESVVKTSFYPTETQLDKLDDLASEYNKRYRRQRPRINRNDIVRHLIDHCSLDSLADLHP